MHCGFQWSDRTHKLVFLCGFAMPGLCLKVTVNYVVPYGPFGEPTSSFGTQRGNLGAILDHLGNHSGPFGDLLDHLLTQLGHFLFSPCDRFREMSDFSTSVSFFSLGRDP